MLRSLIPARWRLAASFSFDVANFLVVHFRSGHKVLHVATSLPIGCLGRLPLVPPLLTLLILVLLPALPACPRLLLVEACGPLLLLKFGARGLRRRAVDHVRPDVEIVAFAVHPLLAPLPPRLRRTFVSLRSALGVVPRCPLVRLHVGLPPPTGCLLVVHLVLCLNDQILQVGDPLSAPASPIIPAVWQLQLRIRPIDQLENFSIACIRHIWVVLFHQRAEGGLEVL
mmetsp:Transcript_85977/g.246811  ORF Transcript_85977/g.246811 Transcript_85977/m.246811 type:complete len:227 (+) Transcript_85977:82-762(+)